MLHKLIFSILFTLLIVEISKPLEVYSDNKKVNNNLLNKFCIASLKSKIDIKNKKEFNEISHFTCECFFKKYNSGFSIRNSRNYCKDKASKKYNL